MKQLIGFAPDMDPTTPGIFTEVTNCIPFEGGYKGAPAAVDISISALAAACVGAVATTDLSGTKRLIAGTGTKLYEVISSAWSDISRAGNYSLAATDRWDFCQYGNSAIAATPTAVLQRSTGSGVAFADISGAPQAKVVESASGFVVAFNTSTSADEWYCSAYLDETNWTLSLANQCVKGRLTSSPGPITAAMRFGDDIAVYKAGSVYIGKYVGAPAVWDFQQVANDVGCMGQDAVVETAFGHVFVGRDNVYVYDGTAPRPLATGTVRKWLFADMSPIWSYKTMLMWDRPNGLVWMFYPSAGSTGTVDRCAVLHVQSARWGLAHQTVEAVVTYAIGSFTYDGGPTMTYTGGPTIPFDSIFWISGSTTPAVFNGSHQLQTLSGSNQSASFVTGDMGDESSESFCNRFYCRFSQLQGVDPSASIYGAYAQVATRNNISDNQTFSFPDSWAPGLGVGFQNGRFDFRQRGRWHRFLVNVTGRDWQLAGYDVELMKGGRR